MHIQHVEIGNFRKLKAVRIDLAEESTVFVGANNSGKTSAMVALRRFLVPPKELTINDFTLTSWGKIDAAAALWDSADPAVGPAAFDWSEVIPFVDVWLNVPTTELHYVQKLLPTVDWAGALIGVRLRYEPKDAAALQQEYLKARAAVKTLLEQAAAGASPAGAPAAAPAALSVAPDPAKAARTAFTFELWPRSMTDFLARRMRSLFEVRAYILDLTALKTPKDGLAEPQPMPTLSEVLEGDPFEGLIRIDEISAQRGFGHPGAPKVSVTRVAKQYSPLLSKIALASAEDQPAQLKLTTAAIDQLMTLWKDGADQKDRTLVFQRSRPLAPYVAVDSWLQSSFELQPCDDHSPEGHLYLGFSIASATKTYGSFEGRLY